jgi:hypothetical protein
MSKTSEETVKHPRNGHWRNVLWRERGVRMVGGKKEERRHVPSINDGVEHEEPCEEHCEPEEEERGHHPAFFAFGCEPALLGGRVSVWLG